MAPKVKISSLVSSTSRYARKAAADADKNQNKKLTATEAKALPKDLRDDYRRQAKTKSAITPESFAKDQAAYVAARAKTADKNHDGYLTETEQATLPATLQDNLASYKAHLTGGTTGTIASPFVVPGAGVPASIGGKNLSRLAVSPIAESLIAKMSNDGAGSQLFSAAWKMKPADMAIAMDTPEFMNELLFESTGTSYLRDYPQYYGVAGLTQASTTAEAQATELAAELKPGGDTGQLLRSTKSLTGLMKEPGVEFRRLSWTNNDDASFTGVMAFNTKTGLITSFGWLNEP